MQLSIPEIALLSRLLDEALPLNQEARRTWLERLAPEYHNLAPALRGALLPGDSDGVAPTGLATLPNLDAVGPSPGSLGPGARVGPYELIRSLGSGGMAFVWLARRADGAFRRDVALKLPRLTHLRADIAHRFGRERDILASLEHPLIARFYDAGVDSNGLQYFAMEYVEGDPLTDWCDDRRLGVRQRLELFLQVLEAVRYAHDKHVLHRDLKPSNILVTQGGQVRLLDFGVAKLLEADEPDQSLTGAYGRAMTPDYASPELLCGEVLDARSDVYSLGVGLYELLTGVRPYQLKTAASIGALERAIATVEVRKPSRQIGPHALTVHASSHDHVARQLRGDLDAIALRALAREPAQRYASVAAFAHDLQCYLAGRPVTARATSLTYRARKFLERNRSIVAVAATITATILALLGYTIYRESAYRSKVAARTTPPALATTARAAAAANTNSGTDSATPSARSVAVLPFADLSEHKDQQYLAEGLSEQLIDRLAYSSDLKVIARTSTFQFKGTNEDVRRIGQKLGVANVLQGTVRKAGDRIRITTRLLNASDDTVLWSRSYDQSVNDIFSVQDDIAAMVLQALTADLNVSTVATADRPQNVAAYNLLLKGNYFFERQQKGDFERARNQYQQALKKDPTYVRAWTQLVRVYVNQGYAHTLTPAAVRSRSLEALHRALAIDPNSPAAHRWLGRIYHAYDWDWTGAERELERAVSLDPRGEDGRMARVDLAYIRAQMSGDLDDAVVQADKALTRNPLDVNSLYFLSALQVFAGRFSDANRTLRRLLEIDPRHGSAIDEYAWLLVLSGRPAEALSVAEKIDDEGDKLSALSMIYWSLGRKPEADAALHQFERKFSRSAPITLAGLYAARGQADIAMSWLERAYQQRDPELVLIKVDLSLAPLRGQARYESLLRQMNLPE
jgi:eukaryotic-like serine/threonine-protein kinase